MKVTSKPEKVNAEASKIYNLVGNCNNFGKFLPEQIKDWESGEDYCQFTIPGITTLKLSIQEKVEFTKIDFKAENDRNIPIAIRVRILPEDAVSTVSVEIEADIPFMLSGMVKKPLQNLVDVIVGKIKTETEK